MKKAVILFTLLITLTSCSTVVSKAIDSGVGTPYSGVVRNMHTMKCYPSRGRAMMLLLPLAIPVGIVDFILSAVMDTVLVPFDLAISPVTDKKSPLRSCKN